MKKEVWHETDLLLLGIICIGLTVLDELNSVLVQCVKVI